MSNSSPRILIGYALAPKKEQSFIQPSLLDLANQRNIDLLRIDPSKPLIHQGPFDCVVHKLYGRDWTHQLQEFSARNPHVPIIDPPEFIAPLHNRVSMLEVVNQLRIPIPQRNEKLGVPKQIVVHKSECLVKGLEAIGELRFPVIAKPVVADGTPKSHEMCLVFNSEGLKQLNVPIVLQEFVNHAGVVFKVYVVGEYVKCEKRRSLPDILDDKLGVFSEKGLVSFSQISNFVGDYSDSCEVEKVESPDLGFVEEIAKAMREAMGLQLFNFDLIRDVSEGIRYMVIDINYFPGYAKMPGYEKVLTDFFLDVVSKRRKIVSNACGGGDGNEEETTV